MEMKPLLPRTVFDKTQELYATLNPILQQEIYLNNIIIMLVFEC